MQPEYSQDSVPFWPSIVFINNLRQLGKTKHLLLILLFIHSPILLATTKDIDGLITSIGLTGALTADSNWQLMEQSLTRDDNPKGLRLNEEQLSAQVTKQVTPFMILGLGFLHDWNTPLNNKSFYENRPYQDIIITTTLYGFNLNLRSRIDQRIRSDNPTTGYRLRESIQINRSLNFLSPKLSAFLGNEIYGYINNSAYGTKGISEDRLQAGFTYQLNQHWTTDFSYLADYLFSPTNNDMLINTLSVNVRYQF